MHKKRFIIQTEENQWLKKYALNLDGLIIELAYFEGAFLDVIEIIGGKRFFILSWDFNVYVVPFVETDKTIFLLTKFSSKKAAQKYKRYNDEFTQETKVFSCKEHSTLFEKFEKARWTSLKKMMPYYRNTAAMNVTLSTRIVWELKNLELLLSKLIYFNENKKKQSGGSCNYDRIKSEHALVRFALNNFLLYFPLRGLVLAKIFLQDFVFIRKQLNMHIWEKNYIQIISLAFCGFLLFLASNGDFGRWLSQYYPCVQDLDPITSFPCYWIYDFWFSVFVLIVGFVLLIQLGVKLFRYCFKIKL